MSKPHERDKEKFMGEIKVVGIFCEKCGQDFTKAVALFGKEVMGWHMAIHKRDELVKENSDLKERIGELEEELANIFTGRS